MEMTNGDGDSKELLESQQHIWNQTFSYMTSMSLRCALQLGIPDILSNHARPVTLPKLVTLLSIQPLKASHLYRLMRLLVHAGIFAVQKDVQDQEGYVLPSSSKLLLKHNWGPLLQMAIDPSHVTPCLYMADWFRGSDSTAFETAHGASLYDYIGKNPDLNARYNEAMACGSRLDTRLLLKDLTPMLEGFESLVDVGGGNGTLAKSIAEAVPNLRCSVYDLPPVISDVKEKSGIAFLAGDMFNSIPSADIILFKAVLTCWNDEDCMKILKRCREAIQLENNKGKLVVIENVIDEMKGTSQLCFDVFMMTCVSGRERIESEWKKLFVGAGFTSHKITPTLGLSSIIEVFP